MRVETIVRASAFALVVAGTSILAAPSRPAQPGQMTQARVWIQNRGRGEAVPVDLRDVNLDTPLKVQVINGDPAFRRTSPLPVREIRQLWDYETITVKPAEDVAARLNALGAAGWETTGIRSSNADGDDAAAEARRASRDHAEHEGTRVTLVSYGAFAFESRYSSVTFVTPPPTSTSLCRRLPSV